MNQNERQRALWAEVEARMDQRLDPLADPALAERLQQEPELLAATERLVMRLDRLNEAIAVHEPARPVFGGRRVAATLAAVAVALVTGFWVLRTGPPAPADESPVRYLPDVWLTVEQNIPAPSVSGRTRSLGEQRVLAWTLEGAE